MDRAAPSVESFHALELRVSEGPQRGARAPLPTGAVCVLACGPDDQSEGVDIVLRDDQTSPVRIRITAELPHAILEIIEGQVTLCGKLHLAGQTAEWAAHVPLSIGNTVIAFGRACLDNWVDHRVGAAAAAGLGSPPGGPEGNSQGDPKKDSKRRPKRGSRTNPEPGADDGAHPVLKTGEDAGQAKPRHLRHRAELWLGATGVAVLLICASAMGMAHYATTPVAAPQDPVASLGQALSRSEFSLLALITRGNGQVVIRGRLSTQEQREKLDTWLADKPIMPTVEVTVDESLAREVTETFRVNGVAVQARVAGPGRIAVDAAERDATVLARAEESVRRDVRGLEALAVRNTARPLPAPAAPVVDDPGKRIASLVPGDTAYLVTADGARYFIGAMLPTGHRIVGIATNSVTLERDGQKTSLNL